MTYTNLWNAIKAACIEIENSGEYTYVGVRFENKSREIGSICECSKHNPNREDERDFPEYGTEEYNDMPELNGTSAWMVYGGNTDWAEDVDASKIAAFEKPSYQKDDEYRGNCKHAYIIAGKRHNTHNDADQGEIVIANATVTHILY